LYFNIDKLYKIKKIVYNEEIFNITYYE
jgi:hypothetical protein